MPVGLQPTGTAVQRTVCHGTFGEEPVRHILRGMTDHAGTDRDWLSERRTLFALAAAVWMSFALLQVVQSFIFARAADRPWTLGGAVLGGFPWWLSWLVLTPVIASLAARYPFTEGRHWEALGKHAVFGVIVALVQVVSVGAIYWFTTGQYSGVASSLGNQVQRFFGNYFLESVVTYAGTAGVFTAIDFARAVRDEAVTRARLEARAAALESSVAQARLDALSMQMNPHFLFNTLTAISGLVSQERKGEAREVIQRLGELLRQSLGNGNGAFSTVAREAALLEDYLYIQRVRFSDRLDATVEIDREARDCIIPAMLLQPLVENAIRHGVEPKEGKGRVRVSVRRENGSLAIRIADSGHGFSLGSDGRPAHEGIGIANTRERLDHMYGANASLVLRNASGGGAEALVTVPAAPEPLAVEQR
jgi:two-component system LytT family sensor kinase